MAKKRYINTKFWDDSYISGLRPEEKLLFLYLLTNPLTNICGIYEITIKRIVFDTGLTEDRVSKTIHSLSKNKKIYYLDGWIYIRNFAKHQSTSPHVKKGIEIAMSEIPQEIKEKIYSIDSVSIEYIESASNSDLNSDSNSNSNKKNFISSFELFWKEYPRGTNKSRAKESWLRMKPSEELVETIMESVRRQKSGGQLSVEEKFIPHASTWLNGKRWEDDIEDGEVCDICLEEARERMADENINANYIYS